MFLTSLLCCVKPQGVCLKAVIKTSIDKYKENIYSNVLWWYLCKGSNTECLDVLPFVCFFPSAPWSSSVFSTPSSTCAQCQLEHCCCQHTSSSLTCSQKWKAQSKMSCVRTASFATLTWSSSRELWSTWGSAALPALTYWLVDHVASQTISHRLKLFHWFSHNYRMEVNIWLQFRRDRRRRNVALTAWNFFWHSYFC